MKYIFINDFSKCVIIFDNRIKKLQFTYSDLEFLNDYPDCTIFYISKECKYLTQYELFCKKDWEEVFFSTQTFVGKPFLWFMTEDMTFETTSERNAAKRSFSSGSDTHFFIDGIIKGGYLHFSFEEFCMLIIDACFPVSDKPQVDSSVVQNINEVKTLIATLTEKFDKLPDQLREILTDDKETSYKAEIATYRNDFYFKSVQRQGLDALIEVLDQLYIQLHNSRNRDIEVQNAINYGIQLVERSLKNAFHIRFISSEEGAVYDPQTMVSFPNESIQTDRVELKDCVAKSISPAVYWTLPMVNSSEREFLYKEESVILYA